MFVVSSPFDNYRNFGKPQNNYRTMVRDIVSKRFGELPTFDDYGDYAFMEM